MEDATSPSLAGPDIPAGPTNNPNATFDQVRYSPIHAGGLFMYIASWPGNAESQGLKLEIPLK